jgi:hypothetical protein
VSSRSSQPVASNSLLHISKKFSSGISSALEVLFEPPLPFQLEIPKFLSTGITAAIFQTSFNALAFNVAAPRKATKTQKKKQQSQKHQHTNFFKQKQNPIHNLTKKNVSLKFDYHKKQSNIPVAAAAVNVMISPSKMFPFR